MTQEILSVQAQGHLIDAEGRIESSNNREYRISFDSSKGFTVNAPLVTEILPHLDDAKKHRAESITIVGVSYVRFINVGGLQDFALHILSDLPDRQQLTSRRLPFPYIANENSAYARLAQTVALGFSLIRLTKMTYVYQSDVKPRGQWLSFNLPLLDHDVLEAPVKGKFLIADQVIETLEGGGASNLDAIRLNTATCELREMLSRRRSYIAGGLSKLDHSYVPQVESFATNATSLAVLGGVFSEVGRSNVPSYQDRWSITASQRDGFWWAKKADGGVDLQLDFAQALRMLSDWPNAGDRILARLIQKGEKVAAQLPVLDFLGLRAASVAEVDGNDLPFPYHNLHMHKTAEGGLEWQRWVALADNQDGTSDKDNGGHTPALWRVSRNAKQDKGKLIVRLEGLADRHFFYLWADHVAAPLRERVFREGDTKKLTLIPEFRGIIDDVDREKGGPWCVELICDEPLNGATPFLGRYRLEHVSIKRMTRRSSDQSNITREGLRAEGLAFPDLRTNLGGSASLAFVGSIDVDIDVNSLDFEVNPDLTWSLTTERHTLTPNSGRIDPKVGGLTVAIGGLDVTFSQGPLNKFRVVVGIEKGQSDYRMERGEGDLALPIASVEVGGTDLQYQEPADQPMVWGTALMGEGHLVGRDFRAMTTGKRVVSLALQPDEVSSKEVEITILDPTPMSVVRVSADKLTAQTATHSTVATWEADQAFWRLTPVDYEPQELRLTFPAQGVAEAWERRKDDLGGDRYLPKDQVGEDKRVPARLTPPTMLRIEGDERARNQIGPWNLKHVLGFSEADLPGARMIRIDRFEVLYGLEGWTGRMNGFRLAEMAAWRGIPREAPTGSSDKIVGRKDVWRIGIDVWQHRLGVLDLREEANLKAQPRIPDARFRLRTKTDDCAAYIKPHGNAEDTDPATGEKKWTDAGDGGILGGVMAGFEQPSVIDSLYGRQDGVGEIDGFQISALGAWSRPRSAFQNGHTLISTEVEMGRVSEARFERKGRIGALHHLAKHVIVYRRAFLRSRQFADEQDEHAGRPIVRKVEEYVEITQPVRTYPDRPGATEMNSGPVKGAQFRTVRIPVHGSWASPLRDPRVKGYSLPLWRESEDPVTYPRPVIDVLFAADPEVSEAEPVSRGVLTPDRLRFYTLSATRGEGSSGDWKDPPGNIEAWPLVYEMDFKLRELDNPVRSGGILYKKRFQQPGNPAATLPPEALEAAGLEDFTLLLEPGPGINVMKGRTSKPAIVDIRSVLMMRARPSKKAPHEAAELRKVTKTRMVGRDLVDLNWAKGFNNVGDIKVEIAKKLGQIREFDFDQELFNEVELCGKVHEPVTKLSRLIAEDSERRPSTQLRRIWEHSRAGVVDELSVVQGQVDALLPLEKSIARLFSPLFKEAERFKARSEDELATILAMIRCQLEQAKEDLLKPLGQVKDEIADLREKIKQTQGDANQWLSQSSGSLAELARRAQGAADRFAAQLPKIEQAADKLRSAAPQLHKTAPGAAKTMLSLAMQLHEAVEVLSSLETGFARELSNQLSKIDMLLKRMADGASDSEERICKALNEAEEGTEGFSKIIKDEVFRLDTQITDAEDEFGKSLKDSIDKATEELKKIEGTSLANLEQAVRDLSTALQNLRMRASEAELPNEALDQLAKAENNFRAKLFDHGVLDSFKEAAETVCGFLEAAQGMALNLLGDWKEEIGQLIQKVRDFGDLNSIREEIASFSNNLQTVLDGVEGVIDGRLLKRIMKEEITPDDLGETVALNALRMAGAPPIVQKLIFNREQIAYHFEQETRRVIITPVTALVDQADRALRSFGLTMPVLGLEETLLSPARTEFDEFAEGILKDLKFRADEILADLAGCKKMLPSVEFDRRLADAIIVTHDYDSKQQVAWLQAEIGYGPKTHDLYRNDSFAIIAERLVLKGLIRYERGLSGGERRKAEASIRSDWVLVLGGVKLIRIRDAVIHSDRSGGMKFDIRPENIEFPGALKLLTEALTKYNGTDKPLSIELLNDPETGKPIGLKSRYDLPPTDLGAGAVSIMNAALGVHLDLAQRSEFEIRSFAYFGRRDSPFAMTLSFLGGGGYIEAEAIHLPALRKTNIVLRVSIGLAAGTAFSFGPLKGSISVFVGFEASFRTGSGGSHISVAAIIVLTGSVTAWGFVTVGLGVRMALTYDGNRAQGRGHIHVSVRISPYYKKNFRRPITYKL